MAKNKFDAEKANKMMADSREALTLAMEAHSLHGGIADGMARGRVAEGEKNAVKAAINHVLETFDYALEHSDSLNTHHLVSLGKIAAQLDKTLQNPQLMIGTGISGSVKNTEDLLANHLPEATDHIATWREAAAHEEELRGNFEAQMQPEQIEVGQLAFEIAQLANVVGSPDEFLAMGPEGRAPYMDAAHEIKGLDAAVALTGYVDFITDGGTVKLHADGRHARWMEQAAERVEQEYGVQDQLIARENGQRTLGRLGRRGNDTITLSTEAQTLAANAAEIENSIVAERIEAAQGRETTQRA